VSQKIERLTEYCTNSGVTPRVDREQGILYGVKILGTQSRNVGQRHVSYPPATLAKAAHLYEGATSNVDHRKSGETVSYRDRIGVIRNVHATNDGLIADYHFNPKHALAEQLCWDAEHAPEKLGFSHLADGKVNRSDPKAPFVETIEVVESVDLVANPATTRGLYESADVPDDQKELCEHGLSAVSDLRTILLGDAELETKKSRLSEVLSVWQVELTGKSSIGKEAAIMEWKELTIEGLRENRIDLVDVLQGTDATGKLQAENKTLLESLDTKAKELQEAQDRIAEIEADSQKQAKKLAIAEELKEAKLDPSNKTLVSDAFIATLESAEDASARKVLIEDRIAITKHLRESTGTPPFGVVGTGDLPAVAKDKKEFLGRL